MNKIIGILCAGMVSVLFCATPAFSEVKVSVAVEKSFIEGGGNDQMVSLSATSDENKTVDVYFGLIAPNGTIYTMPNLTASLTPWLTITLPANYTLPQTELFNAASVPGGLTPGVWQAAIALADPGTQNFIALDLAPFQVVGSTAAADGVTYGFLSLDHQGNNGTASASAIFGRFNGGSFDGFLANIDEMVENFDSNQADLGQCVLNEFSLDFNGDFPDLQFTFLDAGDPLSVALAGSSRTLTKEQESALGMTITSYDADLSNGFFQAGTVTFQGPGGPQVAAFSASASVPAPLTLTTPGAQVTSHSSGNDLNLVWTGADGTGEVTATLSGTDASFSKTVEIVCRFSDDGSAAIPATKISEMRDRLSAENSSNNGGGSVNIPGFGDIDIPNFGDIPDFGDIPGFGSTLSASLVVQRSNYSVFNTSNNGLDFGVLTVNSDASRSLTLQ